MKKLLMQPMDEPTRKQAVATNKERLRKLAKSIVDHMMRWAQLEVGLSSLFKETVRMERESHIPYVIYYTPDGFDTRLKIIDKTITQFILENPKIDMLMQKWSTLNRELMKAKQMRNKIAHGAPIIMQIRGKDHVRLAPPASDINRVGNLIPAGTIPGVDLDELRLAVEKIGILIDCVDTTITVISKFHKEGATTLQETLPPLDACLRRLLSHHSISQTEVIVRDQPLTSSE